MVPSSPTSRSWWHHSAYFQRTFESLSSFTNPSPLDGWVALIGPSTMATRSPFG